MKGLKLTLKEWLLHQLLIKAQKRKNLQGPDIFKFKYSKFAFCSI